nr:MAG TPA: hypothetical protein [Caudoviricetes sp.]
MKSISVLPKTKATLMLLGLQKQVLHFLSVKKKLNVSSLPKRKRSLTPMSFPLFGGHLMLKATEQHRKSLLNTLRSLSFRQNDVQQ